MPLTLAELIDASGLEPHGHRAGLDLVVTAAVTIDAALSEARAGVARVVCLDDPRDAAASALAGNIAACPLAVADDVSPEAAAVVTWGGDRAAREVCAELESVLAREDAAECRRLLEDVRVLTSVARVGDVDDVVAQLAHRINGWVVLVDRFGHPLSTAGAGALHVDDAVALSMGRPVRVRRHGNLHVHHVGDEYDAKAFLVLSGRGGTRSRARQLGEHAATLLDLVLYTHDHSELERFGREVIVRWLTDASRAEPIRILRRWGFRGDAMRAFVVSARSRSLDLERLVLQWYGELGLIHAVTSSGGLVVGLVEPDMAHLLVERARRVARDSGIGLRMGLGAPAALDRLGQTADQALAAHEVGRASGTVVTEFERLGTANLLLAGERQAAVRAIASRLDAIRGTDDAAALRAFLVENGNVLAAAQRLGVHRHTLRARVAAAERATGLSMASIDDRVTAWLALVASDAGASAPEGPLAEDHRERKHRH